jgi:hypothetical protein
LRDLTTLYKEQFSQGSKDYRTMTNKKMMEMLKNRLGRILKPILLLV